MAGLPEGIALRHDWREGDRALVMDLHRQGYVGYDERFSASDVDRLAGLVGAMIDEAGVGTVPDHRVWFAERSAGAEARSTLGCIALIRRGDRGQLRWLILLPKARGLGLGRTLVQTVLDHGRALGLREIYLHTAPGLTESMALYRSVGFEIVRELPADQWHGHGVDVEMMKPL